MNHHEQHHFNQRNHSAGVGGNSGEGLPQSMMNQHHPYQHGGGGGHHSSNPPPHSHPHGQQQPIAHGDGPPPKWHSFKMLIDPMIHHGAPKQVRYDGHIVPGNPHAIPPTPSDPRKKLPSALWRRLEAMELPVPRFVVDENYVGDPPKVEVTIENLNDNVDKQFLGNMIAKFGVVELMEIYYHPKTQKHLGLARLVFEKVRSAKECCDHLHGRSVMGKQLNCYLDPFATSCKKMFDDLTTERKLEPPKPPPPLPNDNNANNKDSLNSSPSLKEHIAQDNNDIDSTTRISSSGSPNDGRYIRNEKSYRDRDYLDNRESRRDSRDRDRHYNDYGRNSSRDSDYNSGSRSRRRGSDYNDRRGDSSWGSRDRYQRGDDRRDSWRHDSRDRDHPHRGSNNDRDYWDHNSSRSNNADHSSTGGRRDRSDSTDYNSSGAYSMDPRHYDPSYVKDSSMYQPTAYDPQYNHPDYWQLQAQQWKAKQAGANGDPSSTTIAPPLPLPPHLQNHHSHSSTPPHASSSTKQLTPHHSDHHTPPSLSRTDSPLLDKENKYNKAGDLNDGTSSRDKSVDKDDESATKTLDHSVDLDTRLKMLMKDKSSAVPAFLLESLQSEEEEEQVEQEVETVVNNEDNHTPSPIVFEETKPLSRAPSPFLSREHYLNSHSEYVRMERVKFETEMGQKSAQKRRGRRGGGRPDSRNSDAMSLSSLSSGENNILEEGPVLDANSHPYPHYYGYPNHPGGHHPSDMTGYYSTPAATGMPGSYPMYPGHPYNQNHPGMPHGYYGSNDPAEWGYTQWSGHQMPGYPNDDPMLMYQGGKADEKAFRPLLRATTERCEHDLKQTLSKDIRKRICETYAFYLYDKWWQEQEEKYKSKQSGSSSSRSKRKDDNDTQSTSNSKSASSGKTNTDTSDKLDNDAKVVKQMPRIPKTEDISNIFDKQRENIEHRGSAIGGAFGKGGSLGFGFRGTIPKLPSFKMKKVGQDRQKSLSEFSSDDSISDRHKHKSSSRYRHSSDRRREKEKRRDRRIREKRDEERRHRNKEHSDDQDENSLNEKKRYEDRKEADSRNKVVSPVPKEGDSGGVKKRTLSDMYKELYSDSGSDWKSDDDDLKKNATSTAVKSENKKQNQKQGQKTKLSSSPSRGWSDKDTSISRSSSPVSSSSSIASSDEEEAGSTIKSRTKKKKRIKSGSSSRSASKSSGHFSSSAASSSEKSTSAASSSEDEKVNKTDKNAIKQKSKQNNMKNSKLEAQKAKAISKRKKKSGSLSSGSKGSTSETSDASSEDESEDSFKPSGSVSTDSSVEEGTKDEDGEKDDVDIEGLGKDEEESRQSTPAKSKMPQRRASTAVKVRTPGVPPPTATPSNGEITSALTSPPFYEESPPHITDHCYARPSSESLKRKHEEFQKQFENEHGYTRPRTPTPPPSASNQKKFTQPATQQTLLKSQQSKLQSTPIARAKAPVKSLYKAPTTVQTPAFKFTDRSNEEEFAILYRFLTKGVNIEDIKYLKMAYQAMLEKIEYSRLVNRTHWVDHTITDLPDPVTPPKKKRRGAKGRDAVEDPQGEDYSKKHLTGSCRTEGYYKMDPREKARTKYHLQRAGAFDQAFNLRNMEGMVTKGPKTTSKGVSREQRSNQRRTKAILGDDNFAGSKLLEFNQLKFRRKNMTFGKSAIHDWGLFAMEYIGADEYVIEYVGVVIRPNLSDVREKRYEKQGIGSSYLFRIDQDYVVDATKCGNLARFINHSCDPNCYAKIITIDGEKKIVIYSKQPIAFGEEITYDYKFPIEDEKIRCLCATKNCRKYLN